MAAPAQIGTLGERSLPTLLAYALTTRHDGALVLTEREAGEHTIGLARGGIVSLSTPRALPSIGRLLVEIGALDERVYARTSGAFGSDDDAYGAELDASGTIPPGALVHARAERIARGVSLLAATLYESTTFSLQRGPAPRSAVPPIDSLPLVLEGAVSRGLDSITKARVDAFAEAPLALADDADVARFRAADEDARVLDVLAGEPLAIGEIARAVSVPRERVRRIVGALVLLDWVAPAY